MKTALLVDDSSFMRELIEKMLRHHGVTVIGEAENGKAGVEKYKELKPDIVVLDIMMDEMTGSEALRQIMEFDPGAKVVVLSSVTGQKPVTDEVTSLGAKAVLVKPPDLKSIEAALASL
ncbi:MAG: response regulator [Oscillospiraceae bacterium]|nr:response regulator [Oscillospiraceae bacterium]